MGKITRELDKESLLNLSPIYTEYTWSVLHSHVHLISYSRCYDLMLKGLSKELTLVLSDTRELNRVSNTK